MVACCMLFVACKFSSKSSTRNGEKYGIMSQQDIDYEEELVFDGAFYEALLDTFCNKHYKTKLKGTYISHSIRVRDYSQDGNTVIVEGTHSFEGDTGDYKDRMFWATVQIVDNSTFEIYFSREVEKPKLIPDFIPNGLIPGVGDKIETPYVPFQFVYHN